ncbi:MAG: hypothetical protein IT226_15665 [Flavobacteriales bacterium]|nr:hypothetical protein [Flavobacteriales bacterium]
MSRIHYFQRYSQRENVVTNNTLLLFSRLHVERPALFDRVLNGLLQLEEEVARLPVGPVFLQQTRSGEGGIPDGDIAQVGWRVLVETKLGNAFTQTQVEGHLKKFNTGERKLLLLLGNELTDRTAFEALVLAARAQVPDVSIENSTFETLINLVRDELQDWDEELLELIDDYAGFCNEEGLLPYSQFMLRAVTAGDTIDLNKKHGVYFDLDSSGYSAHTYMGLYTDKSVQAVGKLLNVISVEMHDGKLGTPVSRFSAPIDQTQLDRIQAMITETTQMTSYTPQTGHRFFVVDEFHDTDFRKVSKGAARRGRYFDLRKVLEFDGAIPAPNTIAEQLNDKEWQ